MAGKPEILTFETYDNWDTEPMQESYTLHQFPASSDAMDLPSEVRDQIRAFAFKGHSALDAKIIDCFPNLGLIANYGVGYDTIDVKHASSRGIKVTNTPDVLTNDVADLAVGMLLALNRGIVGASDWVRSGNWAKNGAFPLQRTLTDVPVGIVGLGRIGRAVAQRLQAFESEIHYYSRTAKDTPGWIYHNDLTEMASAVDILMIAVSGGPDTAGIISAQVIDALGADGLIVNSARGTTVDESALIHALQNKQLRGAALDVFNNEPNIDPGFHQMDNVLLQPHQSSGTIETRKKMGVVQRKNIDAYFANQPLLTQVN